MLRASGPQFKIEIERYSQTAGDYPVLVGLLWAVLQAGAATAAPMQCELRENKVGQQAVLTGGCGQSGVTLRSAAGDETAQNRATGSTAVVTRSGDGIKVLVIRPDREGRSIIEDLTDELAARAGRNSRAGLSGLTIDLSRFADEGRIGLAAGKSSLWLSQFSVADLVKADAERLSAATLAVPVVSVVPEGKGPESVIRRTKVGATPGETETAETRASAGQGGDAQ